MKRWINLFLWNHRKLFLFIPRESNRVETLISIDKLIDNYHRTEILFLTVCQWFHDNIQRKKRRTNLSQSDNESLWTKHLIFYFEFYFQPHRPKNDLFLYSVVFFVVPICSISIYFRYHFNCNGLDSMKFHSHIKNYHSSGWMAKPCVFYFFVCCSIKSIEV